MDCTEQIRILFQTITGDFPQHRTVLGEAAKSNEKKQH